MDIEKLESLIQVVLTDLSDYGSDSKIVRITGLMIKFRDVMKNIENVLPEHKEIAISLIKEIETDIGRSYQRFTVNEGRSILNYLLEIIQIEKLARALGETVFLCIMRNILI